MVDFRLTSYEADRCKTIVECHIVGQWDVSKERKTTQALQNHAYIRQLVQKLMKCYSQASQRAWQIVCTVYHRYTNSFLCMPKITKANVLMFLFFPIAYHSLSTECPWFFLFFTTNCNICFILGNVFHGSDRKIPYAILHQIIWDSYST